jgi:hypothetical protein
VVNDGSALTVLTVGAALGADRLPPTSSDSSVRTANTISRINPPTITARMIPHPRRNRFPLSLLSSVSGSSAWGASASVILWGSGESTGSGVVSSSSVSVAVGDSVGLSCEGGEGLELSSMLVPQWTQKLASSVTTPSHEGQRLSSIRLPQYAQNGASVLATRSHDGHRRLSVNSVSLVEGVGVPYD